MIRLRNDRRSLVGKSYLTTKALGKVLQLLAMEFMIFKYKSNIKQNT